MPMASARVLPSSPPRRNWSLHTHRHSKVQDDLLVRRRWGSGQLWLKDRSLDVKLSSVFFLGFSIL